MGNPARTRRRFTFSEKERILNEHLQRGLSISVVARKHQISPVTLHTWKRKFMSEKMTKSSPEIPRELLEKLEALEKENSRLKKTVADLAIDKSILKEALDIQFKKSLAPAKSKRRKK